MIPFLMARTQCKLNQVDLLSKDDEDDVAISMDQEVVSPPKKRGRGRKSAVKNDTPESTKKKRKPQDDTSKSPSKVHHSEPDTLDASTRASLTRVMKECYDAVEQAEAEIEDEVSGVMRYRSELFLTLPDPVSYADYYTLIKTPLSLEMISQRINVIQ